jgi:hypothetical protein
VTGVPTLARGSAGVMVLRVWTGEPSIGAGLTIPLVFVVAHGDLISSPYTL